MWITPLHSTAVLPCGSKKQWRFRWVSLLSLKTPPPLVVSTCGQRSRQRSGDLETHRLRIAEMGSTQRLRGFWRMGPRKSSKFLVWATGATLHTFFR